MAAVLLVGGLVLFQPWRLLTRSTVDEALPVAATTSVDGGPAGQGSTPAGDMPTPTATESPTSARTAINVLAEGRFVDAEHSTTGTARIVQLADGSRYLRLEGFSTSDGPDVDVWLTDQPAGGDWHRY
ncbi:MAG TPA: DM13 domain-containing protein, partial [Humibacillus xanthopallidus]|nr:DM13 domain-containing protein [Humibacillus xanthopallidus]